VALVSGAEAAGGAASFMLVGSKAPLNTMQHERLTPGTHLRKNTKQILAMLRASAQRAGFECEFEQQGSRGARARLVPAAGGDPVGSVEVNFTTDGLEAHLVGGSETRTAMALYTDTRWLMEDLEALLAELAR
jgi:hypothetical protein